MRAAVKEVNYLWQNEYLSSIPFRSGPWTFSPKVIHGDGGGVGNGLQIASAIHFPVFAHLPFVSVRIVSYWQSNRQTVAGWMNGCSYFESTDWQKHSEEKLMRKLYSFWFRMGLDRICGVWTSIIRVCMCVFA